MKLLRDLAGVLLLACGACSCSSPILKPAPAEISPFIVSAPPLKADTKVSPFDLSGGSPVSEQKGIYIAPVTVEYLRPASKGLAKGEEEKRKKEAAELAQYAQAQFVEAFRKSPKARYVVKDKPDRDCVKLELAIVELNRNTFTGTVVRFAVNTVAVPGTDVALAKFARPLKGNIAIEGKVTNVRDGKVIYQFADNEESKSAVILPVTDLHAYGQARDAIHDWAKEFEEVTRTAPGEKVKGSSVMSFF